jgi:hypothetical protein
LQVLLHQVRKALARKYLGIRRHTIRKTEILPLRSQNDQLNIKKTDYAARSIESESEQFHADKRGESRIEKVELEMKKARPYHWDMRRES